VEDCTLERRGFGCRTTHKGTGDAVSTGPTVSACRNRKYVDIRGIQILSGNREIRRVIEFVIAQTISRRRPLPIVGCRIPTSQSGCPALASLRTGPAPLSRNRMYICTCSHGHPFFIPSLLDHVQQSPKPASKPSCPKPIPTRGTSTPSSFLGRRSPSPLARKGW